MDHESKKEILRILNAELRRQKAIFNKHAPKVIFPNNSPEYDAAKKAFDNADWQIKDITKQIAYITCEETYEPTVIDKIFEYVKKLGKDGSDKGKDADIGVRG